MHATSNFEVLPAIDLRGGRVVRLRQGDFEHETAYGDDPAEAAHRFVEAGARWLHVVDLDAARTGIPANGAAVASIIEAAGETTRVEVAGGLRNADAVAAVLASGAARAVVGTAAIDDPRFAGRIVDTHGPDRIVVAIDVRGGHAIGHGWSHDDVGQDAGDVMARLADAGVSLFEVTAIDRDGLLEGPDLELYERLVQRGLGAIIASGGIATLDDLRDVRARGCVGAIVGRAFYEGRVNLGQALAVAAETG